MPAPHPCGEIAILHLLASDLRKVKSMLEGAGRKTTLLSTNDREELFVEPDPRDGFAFLVQEGSVNAWLPERMNRTGERIEIEEG